MSDEARAVREGNICPSATWEKCHLHSPILIIRQNFTTENMKTGHYAHIQWALMLGLVDSIYKYVQIYLVSYN